MDDAEMLFNISFGNFTRSYNDTAFGYDARTYSPLMLSNEWPAVGRLIFMLSCASFGSIVNGFFVASFFVEARLRKLGNIFLACAGLADLLITAGVMSVSAVLLLSGQWDNVPVCRALQIVTEAAVYAYNLFFMSAAIENVCRVFCSSKNYRACVKMPMCLLSVALYCLCFGLATAGVFLEFDYDYCERLHYGNMYFRITTAVSLQALPVILTLFCFGLTIYGIRRRARHSVFYRRSDLYERERASICLNILAYLLFVVAWIPYVVIVYVYPDIGDAKYYNCVWLGLFRSIVTSFMYGVSIDSYSRPYCYLFHYCFCKRSVYSSIVRRRARTRDYNDFGEDLRCQVMRPAMGTPRRAVTICVTENL